MAIKINKLVKQYKNGVRALDEISLHVKHGEIFSLLGPNGAGKSSLINILTTYYKPSSGEATVLEKDLYKNQHYIRQHIACVSQHVSIDDHLSLMENMQFQSRLYKVDSEISKKRIDMLIDCFGLSKYLKYPTSSYSGGIKRRLDIAMNMVSHPKILFLDEPTVGMDIESRKAMWEMMKKIRDDFGTTIFLTTHYLEEADQLSDTICIMKNGREIAQGTPESFRDYIRKDIIRIGFSDIDQAKSFVFFLSQKNIMKFLNTHGNFVFIDMKDSYSNLQTITKQLLEHNVNFSSIEIVRPTFEDIFLNLIGKEETI